MSLFFLGRWINNHHPSNSIHWKVKVLYALPPCILIPQLFNNLFVEFISAWIPMYFNPNKWWLIHAIAHLMRHGPSNKQSGINTWLEHWWGETWRIMGGCVEYLPCQILKIIKLSVCFMKLIPKLDSGRWFVLGCLFEMKCFAYWFPELFKQRTNFY